MLTPVRKKLRAFPAQTDVPRIWAILFLTSFTILLFFHTRTMQLRDYADWTYEGVMLRDAVLGHGGSGVAFKSYPVPNTLVTVGIGGLCLLLPWQIASKVWLALYFALIFAVVDRVTRFKRASPITLWMILPVVLTGLDFWFGFINFLLAVVLTILFSSMLNKREENGWKYAVLLTLIFFTHFIPFAFCCLLLFFYALQTRRFGLLWQAVPSAVLTVWYVLGRFTVGKNVDASTPIEEKVGYLSPGFWAFKVNSFLKSFAFINPEARTSAASLLRAMVGDAGYIALFLLNAVLATIVVWILAKAFLASFRERRDDLFFWIAFLVAMALFLIAPVKALGVSDPGSRILQAALWTALLFAAPSRRSGWMIAMVAIPFSVLNLWLFAVLIGKPQPVAGSEKTKLPSVLLRFGGIEYTRKDYYYDALREYDESLPVFPTGIFRPVRGK